MHNRILLVDDEQNILEIMKMALQDEGYDVVSTTKPKEALNLIQNAPFDALITDIKMAEMDGITLLRKVKERYPEMVVILITAYASIETAIQSLREGAADYIMKPFRIEELKIRLSTAIDKMRLKRENIVLRKHLQEDLTIIGISNHISELKKLIKKVSGVDSSVLITGESGTGKELVARLIHFSSFREGTFVSINCAAIPENLLESELFGYKKGAFTGAVQNKEGLFKSAHKGTLFLDEIAEMPLPLQSKLLRVLQSMEFTPLGETKPVKVDVRVISATNTDIEKRIKDGLFREDLYYRLNVIPVHILPLRERIEDIPVLIHYFIKRISKRLGVREKRISPEGMEILKNYKWPGNVRELENIIERLIVLNEGNVITPGKFPDYIKPKNKKEIEIPDINLTEIEKKAILNALHNAGGDKRRAAKMLGIHLSTLYRKLKKMGKDI